MRQDDRAQVGPDLRHHSVVVRGVGASARGGTDKIAHGRLMGAHGTHR